MPTARDVARRLRDGLGRTVRMPRVAWLLSRDRVISYLRPYWLAEEVAIGQRWPPTPGGEAAIEELEATFPAALGLEGVAVVTSSGRTAMRLALRALRRRDRSRTEVVIPSYCCQGLVLPILDCGLVPVFVDVGADLNATEAAVAPHVSARTLAVVIVHLGGKYAPEAPSIAALARARGATVIDDVCQALGGRLNGRPWGVDSAITFYSFGLGKNVMATAGGMVIARDLTRAILEEKAALDREEPGAPRARFAYMMTAFQRDGLGVLNAMPPLPQAPFGSSYGHHRMSELDAQLVRQQLGRLTTILERRRANAEALVGAIGNVPGLTVPGAGGPNVWTKFTVLAASPAGAARLRRRLAAAGVETETMYTPLHLRDVGRPWARGPLPQSERVWERAFNLPVRPSLTPAQVAYIAARVRQGASAEDGSR